MNGLRQCSGCAQYMRPRATLLVDFPGTVQHRGRGLCQCCWRKAARSEQRPTNDGAWVRAQRGHVLAYLAWRGRTDRELVA